MVSSGSYVDLKPSQSRRHDRGGGGITEGSFGGKIVEPAIAGQVMRAAKFESHPDSRFGWISRYHREVTRINRSGLWLLLLIRVVAYRHGSCSTSRRRVANQRKSGSRRVPYRTSEPIATDPNRWILNATCFRHFCLRESIRNKRLGLGPPHHAPADPQAGEESVGRRRTDM